MIYEISWFQASIGEVFQAWQQLVETTWASTDKHVSDLLKDALPCLCACREVGEERFYRLDTQRVSQRDPCPVHHIGKLLGCASPNAPLALARLLKLEAPAQYCGRCPNSRDFQTTFQALLWSALELLSLLFQVMAWLKCKIQKTVAGLRSLGETYTTMGEKDLDAYAVGMLCEYLSPKWQGKLRIAYGIEEPGTYPYTH